MESRALGKWGLNVSALGLGCVGMSEFYGRVDKREAIRAIHKAIDLGITLFDTADIYGHGENEQLLGKAVARRREAVTIATKFGNIRLPSGEFTALNGRPEYVARACDASLARLGTDVIDLYQLHRTDPKTPIEETVGAMRELVQVGKVRFLGLSETRCADLERAAAVAPISTLQSEYSLLERNIELDTIALCSRNGIGILAYSPLGRGLLTGTIRSEADFDADDSRRDGRYPRLVGDALTRNLKLAETVVSVANASGHTPTQIALAWLLAKDEAIVPIPGAKRVAHVRENCAATEITLSNEMRLRLDSVVGAGGAAYGDRYLPDQIPNWISPALGANTADEVKVSYRE